MKTLTRGRLADLDWSTINLEELNKLPVAVLTHGDHLQEDSGTGCAGDPPGFPTYFTRTVYSNTGDNARGEWEQVIGDRGTERTKWKAGETWEQRQAKQHALFLKLWKPLPIDHPRTAAWIQATFKHHNHCYHAPEHQEVNNKWSDTMLIWPGGCCGETPFGKIKDEAFEVEYTKNFDKWAEENKAAFIADIRAHNAPIVAKCKSVATPDNHDGTILVRRYYPEFQPSPELIAGDFESPGNWWETLTTKPTPEECPGQYSNAHPVNGSWCQFCGWHAPATEAKAA